MPVCVCGGGGGWGGGEWMATAYACKQIYVFAGSSLIRYPSSFGFFFFFFFADRSVINPDGF